MNLSNSLFSRLSIALWIMRITAAKVDGKKMSMITHSGILLCLRKIIPTRVKILGAIGNHPVLPMLIRNTSFPTVMLTNLRLLSLSSLLLLPLMLVMQSSSPILVV